MSQLVAAYKAAGYFGEHLVNQNASPRKSTMPLRQLDGLWLHFRGAEIDDATVLARWPRRT